MDDKIIDSETPAFGISEAQSQIMDLLAPEEEKAEQPDEAIDESSVDAETGSILPGMSSLLTSTAIDFPSEGTSTISSSISGMVHLHVNYNAGYLQGPVQRL